MLAVFFIFNFLIPSTTFAVCPLCTVAVGAGIGLTQYCGIDDTITSLWIGGFIVSLISLTQNWFKKQRIIFYGYKAVIMLAYYISVIVPLYLIGTIGHPLNTLWGIDKVLLGVIIGSLAFFTGAVGNEKLKQYNHNKAYFPFQKIVVPVSILIVLSIVFYSITK